MQKLMQRLFLIDSSALAFRMYYAYVKNPLRNSKGQLVSLLHGYWGTILRILKSHKPEYFAIVKDVARTNFRHEFYPEYKATRSPMPPEMSQQMPHLNESLEKSGLPILERKGFEADDIMAAVALLAAEKNCSVFLVTKDKDMAQIVDDKIRIYQIEKGAKGVEIGIAQVKEKFGVNPEQMRDYLALVGDDSDNIPGVAKIGPKSAVELLSKYGDLENIYKNLAELPKSKQAILEAGRENAFLSRKLVTLRSDYDFGYKLENLKCEGLKRNELFKFFTDYEVPSLIPLLPANDGYSLFATLPEPPIEEKNIQVNTVEDLQKMEADLKSAKILAFATLADGAISVSKNENEFYKFSDSALCSEWLKEIFKNENLELVFHNAKAMFKEWEFPRGKFWDTLFAQWLLRPSAYHGNSPENAAVLFAKWKNQKDELKQKNLFELFENNEMPLIKVLCKMEQNGIAIDNAALENLNSEFQRRVAELEAHIFEIAEENFNLASPKQLSHILYEKLKLPMLKKNASGPSTDAETLEMLLEQNEPHPILEPIMNWREIQKLKGTYTEALPKMLSPKTNRLHTTFLPWGTVTGRLSSVNPNLQNIPVRSEAGRRIRSVFVPSQKDWKIISVDYSQIELRMLAHLSGDPELSNAFLQGLDIHSITAAKIFGTSEVSKEMRAAAKIVNFGVIYGMSAFRLARDLRITRSKAMEFINGYFNLYSKVKTYFEEVVKVAKESGFVETIAKRRRYLPELQASDHQERAMAERMAMNSPIQGSAADLITEAMLRLHAKIENENLPLKMLLQVHDELVFECPKENAEEFSQIIKFEMENAWPISVPILVNIGIGNNWLEAH
jgi:DNA polymerase-1